MNGECRVDTVPVGSQTRWARRLRRYCIVLSLVSTLFHTASAAPGPGGVSSDNVEWIRNVPFAAGYAEGGRVVGDSFFVTVNGQGLLIFDISAPEDPQLVGRLAAPHFWENEDIATNGKIALLSQRSFPFTYSGRQDLADLSVVDVEDRSNPRVIATVPGGGDHTYECLYDCAWAYGSVGGGIYDLREPSEPRMLEQRWTRVLPPNTFIHDVTEVRPGLVLTASTPMYLLDVRKDITRPKVLAVSELSTNSGHNVVWPRRGKDRLVLTATEYDHVRCETRDEESDAAFEVWDGSRWRLTKTLSPVGQWRVPGNGVYVDGQPAVSGFYGCSAHWFEPHPDFHNGGSVALGFYGHGVRFLDVKKSGKIDESGYFLGWGANVSAAYWITDEIVYTIDMQRGIDILKVDGPS
jgi:hypothetical protein